MNKLKDIFKMKFGNTALYRHLKGCRKKRMYIVEAKRLVSEASKVKDSKKLVKIVESSKIFSMNQQELEILQLLDLVKTLRPKRVMEIGTFRGGTLFLLSQFCGQNSKIISLDNKYPPFYKSAMKKFSSQGRRISFFEMDSHDSYSKILIERSLAGKKIDFLFIDGDHSYEGTKKDFEMYSPLVRSGGMIAFHDINPDTYIRTGVKSSAYVGGVPFYWKEVKATYPETLELIQDESQDGYGIGILFIP
jgi:predicted O-methyltransferase YrrM